MFRGLANILPPDTLTHKIGLLKAASDALTDDVLKSVEQRYPAVVFFVWPQCRSTSLMADFLWVPPSLMMCSERRLALKGQPHCERFSCGVPVREKRAGISCPKATLRMRNSGKSGKVGERGRKWALFSKLRGKWENGQPALRWWAKAVSLGDGRPHGSCQGSPRPPPPPK